MFDSGVESLGRGILCEAKDVPAPNAGHPPGARDEQEAQGAHAPQDVGVGALAGAASRLGDGGELKASGEVVGHDAEVLPGAVGPVVAGRDVGTLRQVAPTGRMRHFSFPHESGHDRRA